MGRFMIPVCCICGMCAQKWHSLVWEDFGGLQDFCPKHANLIREQYGNLAECIVPHMAEKSNKPLKSQTKHAN